MRGASEALAGARRTAAPAPDREPPEPAALGERVDQHGRRQVARRGSDAAQRPVLPRYKPVVFDRVASALLWVGEPAVDHAAFQAAIGGLHAEQCLGECNLLERHPEVGDDHRGAHETIKNNVSKSRD